MWRGWDDLNFGDDAASTDVESFDPEAAIEFLECVPDFLLAEGDAGLLSFGRIPVFFRGNYFTFWGELSVIHRFLYKVFAEYGALS